MKNNKGNILLLVCGILIAALLLYPLFRNRPVTHGPGVIAPEPPKQVNLHWTQNFKHKDYTIKPLADFEIRARVLSRNNYFFGRNAELSPVDLALGWGRMSDEAVLKDISISQSNRWYQWYVRKYPIPRREIEQSSANMHLIPSTPEIKKLLEEVRGGQVVKIKGYLVKITAKDNWQWCSSLSRDDIGNGSCELIWVKDFNISENISRH